MLYKTFKNVLSTICMIAVVICTACPAQAGGAGPSEEDVGQLYLWDFDEENAQISDYPIQGATNTSNGIQSEITDGVLIYNYTSPGKSANNMYLNMSDYLDGVNSFVTEYSLKPIFAKNNSFVLRCGVNIQLLAKDAEGNFVAQCNRNGSFVTENTAQFNFQTAKLIRFVVKNRETVDFYIGETPETMTKVYEGLEYTVTSTLQENKLGFTFNKSYGGTMQLDNIRLTTTMPIQPDITTLAFKNCNETLNADKDDTLQLELDAEADSGIEKVEIYANDTLYETLTQSPYIVSVNANEEKNVVIKACATSNGGDTKSVELSVNFRQNPSHTVFEDSDFEGEEDTFLNSGIWMYSRRGFVKPSFTDEEHGNSLLIGIDKADTSYTDANIPYADIPLNGFEGRLSFECDFNVSSKENSGKKCMVFRCDNGKEINILRFMEPQIFVQGKEYVDYDTEKWYHLTVKLDTLNRTIDVFINGFPIVTDSNAGSSLSPLSFIRMYGPGDDTTPTYTALDNISVKGYYDTPEIVSLDAEAFDTGEISAKLSSQLYAQGLTPDTVFIMDAQGNKCLGDSVTYDAAALSVTLKLKYPLMPDSDYTFVISGDAEIAEGVTVGESVEAQFKTKPDLISVKNCSITVSGGICKASLSVKNEITDAQTVYAVLVLWNGNKAVQMKIAPIEAGASETKDITLEAVASGADAAEVYIYDSIIPTKYLLSGIHRKEW